MEQLTRTIAQRASRPPFSPGWAKLMLRGMVVPLLSIDRVPGHADAPMSMDHYGTSRTDDPSTFDHCDPMRARNI